jgi:hypothetical protein
MLSPECADITQEIFSTHNCESSFLTRSPTVVYVRVAVDWKPISADRPYNILVDTRKTVFAPGSVEAI